MPCALGRDLRLIAIMNKDGKIFVAGHSGMVGGAIVRGLQAAGFQNLLLASRKELDLTNQLAVNRFFDSQRPGYVFLSAAKVGGIHANNTYPADFIRDNLAIEMNIIDAAYRNGVKKLLFLGSSCIYPKFAPQPMKEEYLLTGPLETTNEWYAIAKIAGIKLCQAYRKQYGFNAISLMPSNLYGPGDNFNLENSHVLPALLRKFHEAKIGNAPSVEVWGTGDASREFLHVDDLAAAALFLMDHYNESSIVNVGIGKDITIGEVAELIQGIVGFKGKIEFNTAKPDGTPRKRLDVTRLKDLGWEAEISINEGLRSSYEWFLRHQSDYRQ